MSKEVNDIERKSLILYRESEEKDDILNAIEKNDAKERANRLISGINHAFANEEEFEPLFSILNSTGEYIRKLIKKEINIKQAIWSEIKKDLQALNNAQRDKLRMVLAILMKLNAKLRGNPPPGTYLNDKVHENIDEALKLFNLQDNWFEEGSGTVYLPKERYIFALRSSSALLDEYINYKTFRDKMANFLGYSIAFGTACGVGVGAYFGCTQLLLGTSASLATAAAIAGVPYLVLIAGLSLAITIFVLSYAIGKTADHRKRGRNIGMLIAVGILITFCILPFIISFPLPVLTIFSKIGIWSLSFITFSVNYLIYSDVVPQITTRISRGDTFKKDNGTKMTKTKIGLMIIVLLLALMVGTSVCALFLFLSNPHLHISFLAILGFGACLGALFGYSFMMFEKTLCAARATEGLKGAFRKLFKPAFETFKEYGSRERVIAWSATIVICGAITYGTASLGMAQAVALQNLLVSAHVSTHTALIIGHLMGTGATTLLLLPFYLTAVIICVGLLFKFIKSFKSKDEKKNENLKNLSDEIKGRDVKLWGENGGDEGFSQQLNEVLESKAENDNSSKKIIITKWQENSWVIFTEINGAIAYMIVSKNKDSKFYDSIEAYSNERTTDNRNKLKDYIYKSFISKDRRWFRDIANSALKNKLLVPFNALVNASFVPGGGIKEIWSAPTFVWTTTAGQGACSASVGFSSDIPPSQNEYRNVTITTITGEVTSGDLLHSPRNLRGSSASLASIMSSDPSSPLHSPRPSVIVDDSITIESHRSSFNQ